MVLPDFVRVRDGDRSDSRSSSADDNKNYNCNDNCNCHRNCNRNDSCDSNDGGDCNCKTRRGEGAVSVD